MNGSIRNGYSILTALKSSSTLGYGFQWSNTFENEYMDYNNYKGAIRSKVESLFRWTYELGRNWAFSPEISVKAEKYFSINLCFLKNDLLLITSVLSIGSFLSICESKKSNFLVILR